MTQPLHVVVCGGRDYTDRARVFAVLDGLAPELVRHGCCGLDATPGWAGGRWSDFVVAMSGADRWTEEWHHAQWDGNHHAPQIRRHPAPWDLGHRAGPLRNGWMLGAALLYSRAASARLLVVAFPGGKGTADCIRQARGLGIEVMEVSP